MPRGAGPVPTREWGPGVSMLCLGLWYPVIEPERTWVIPKRMLSKWAQLVEDEKQYADLVRANLDWAMPSQLRFLTFSTVSLLIPSFSFGGSSWWFLVKRTYNSSWGPENTEFWEACGAKNCLVHTASAQEPPEPHETVLGALELYPEMLEGRFSAKNWTGKLNIQIMYLYLSLPSSPF